MLFIDKKKTIIVVVFFLSFSHFSVFFHILSMSVCVFLFFKFSPVFLFKSIHFVLLNHLMQNCNFYFWFKIWCRYMFVNKIFFIVNIQFKKFVCIHSSFHPSIHHLNHSIWCSFHMCFYSFLFFFFSYPTSHHHFVALIKCFLSILFLSCYDARVVS